MAKMNIIAAVDLAGGIGKKGGLPWHLPEDFKQFVRLTTETKDSDKRNAVIMGRKCWESIPEKFRPLKNRLSVVLSTSLKPSVSEDVIIANSIDEALNEIMAVERKIETIWNIGGRQIYELGLDYPNLHRIYLTQIEHNFETDVSFPQFDQEKFELENVGNTVTDKGGYEWKLMVYRNKQSSF
ncbi:unnamed protein product [Bursaphelenchus xylophilus]|uniref:dihydrofolate reductase n=1 Tax=Bursaphelenchus xylophilus TaxID=6326 RepID=A0A1I7S621_BURXY|nr:unnamed protein product [Bursaphelenchus xylophilus]CAG9082366.1 unnamed protein product [Bursaphelenchus xylophilus]